METLLTKTKKDAQAPAFGLRVPLPDDLCVPSHTGLEIGCDGEPSSGRSSEKVAHPSRSAGNDPEPAEAELLFDVVERVLRKL